VPDTIWLDSFPGPLGQVLSNMINNAAIHAYGDEGGLVTVSARLLPGRVRIRISDEGKGMSPEIQRRVFDPFFTTRMGQGGNGLGLHIAHNIIYQMLGGSITLVSGEGAGTRFDIVIPLELPEHLAA
jgi:signal transduction histidine kinase